MFPFLNQLFNPPLPPAQEPPGALGIPNVNTTELNSPFKDRLGSLFDLPTEPSANAVVSETEAAARAEASGLLLRKFSQQRLRRMNALAGSYQTAAAHLKGVQKIQNRVEKTDADLLKALLGHKLETRQNVAEVRGYDAAYNSSLGSIDL